MQEDSINVFCLAHGVSFTMPRSNQVVICKKDLADHVLSNDFPNSGRWFYCCQCHIYWVSSKAQGGFLRQCPSCGLIKNPRYYSCDQCNVTMMDSWGATNQRDIYITPWGAPHPYCPGCYQLPKSIPLSHTCSELKGLLTTAHAECPFCEVEESTEAGAGIAESKEIYPKSAPEDVIVSINLPARVEHQNGLVDQGGARRETEIAQVDSEDVLGVADEAPIFLVEEIIKGWDTPESEAGEDHATNLAPDWIRVEANASDLFLEEIEKRTAEVRALEAEAEARAAKAQERLRQAEIRLQLEMSLRSEAEQKSKDIEEELRRKLEDEGNHLEVVSRTFEMEAKAKDELGMIDAMEQAWLETVSITSEITAEIEEERKARLAAEQAKAEAKVMAHESESRAVQAETLARQTEERCQFKIEEAVARTGAALLASTEAQKKVDEAEARFREMEARAGEAEERRRQAEAGLQQAREEVKAIKNNAHAEIEAVKNDAQARIETEAQARSEAEQAMAEARNAEAEAKQTVENYIVEITKIKAEAEARVLEVEAKAKQAEEVCRLKIAGIRAELEITAAAAKQAEENYRTEIAKVNAEAEAQANQAEANARRQCQTKVEEAIASAQVAMFTLEETQKKLIEVEAKYREMEVRARRAETRSRQA